MLSAMASVSILYENSIQSVMAASSKLVSLAGGKLVVDNLPRWATKPWHVFFDFNITVKFYVGYSTSRETAKASPSTMQTFPVLFLMLPCSEAIILNSCLLSQQFIP